MSAAAAWAVTIVCGLVAVLSAIVSLVRRDAATRRVSLAMMVSVAGEVLVAETVPWGMMWLPLLAIHLGAMAFVFHRPANKVNVVVGAFYCIAASIDVAFMMHPQHAVVWSLYMDLLNGVLIAQAGALLMGVLTNGRFNRDSNHNRRSRVGDISGIADLGFPR